ncbi:MAG TPA: VOC family protein [Steroidobacteraceae bacterium]|jgi:PhnB protein
MQPAAHLNFKGNCAEAFKFYADTFGGKIVFSLTYGESPVGGETSDDFRDKIMHARVDFGGQYLLGCDAPHDYFRTPQGISIHAAIEEPQAAERAFKALSEGGAITMPFAETFWAKGFGMCTDRFGIPWMVNCEKPLADTAALLRKSA